MGCALLITGIYWGYNPFTNHLLTSWDILVSIELAFFNRKRRSINSATNQAFECFFPHLMSFKPRKNQHTTPGHPRSNQKLKVRLHIMQFVPKNIDTTTIDASPGPKYQWTAISLIPQDLRRISPVEG